MQRPVALRADGGGERVIVRLGVVADDLDLLLDEPFAGGGDEAGRVTLASLTGELCQEPG